jgi:itaconyl-CoA hydratase
VSEQDSHAPAVPIAGWTGRFFEDFRVGDVYRHRLGRTITTADNRWFTQLTMNTNPVHLDEVYASQTPFGRVLVNSAYTLALVTGLSVADVSQNAFANLGWDAVRLPHPVFEGDTIYAQSEVLETRVSRSRPNVGIVRVRSIGYNQDGVTVIAYERTIMVYRRGPGPAVPPPREPLTGSRAGRPTETGDYRRDAEGAESGGE